MAKGNPVILHGLTSGGENWQKVSTTIRDVSVYLVPAYHDKSQGLQRGKNAIFVFRVDDVCIAHLGDLGHVLTPAQLKLMEKSMSCWCRLPAGCLRLRPMRRLK